MYPLIQTSSGGGGGGPPDAHAASHENGGSDEVSVTGLSGLLGDPQTPLAHDTSHENGGSDEINVAGLSGLLADGQTPLSHKTSHENGGSDEISVAGLSGLLADGQTPLAHATSHIPGAADAISTAAPTTNLTASTSNAVGTGVSLARNDHSHALTTGAPGATGVATAAAVGSSASLARADHLHQANTAPATIGTANAIGTSGEPARADHVHNAGTIAVANGGTGQTTAHTAMRALNPLYTPTHSATPTWTPNTDGFRFAPGAMTADVTLTVTTTGMSAGDVVHMIWTQDGTGGREVVWPSTFKLVRGVRREANAISVYILVWDGTNFRPLGVSGRRIRSLSGGGTYAVTKEDHHTLLLLTGASAWTITMLDRATYLGMEFSIVRVGAGVVTINRAGSDTLIGFALDGITHTSYADMTQDDVIDFFADDTHWRAV